MKPGWKDAPEKANWLAMDGDGYWVWHELEPEWSDEENGWMLGTREGDEAGDYEYAEGGPDFDGIDWDNAFDTLEPKP